jgi:hypothetical protein
VSGVSLLCVSPGYCVWKGGCGGSPGCSKAPRIEKRSGSALSAAPELEQSMHGSDKAASQRYEGHAALAGNMASVEGKRVPEVVEQIQRLEKSLAFVDESTRELMGRLQTITRPPGPETPPQAIGPAGPSTELAAQLHTAQRRASDIGDRLQDVLRRLEL